MNIVLWIVQALLALAFLASGALKATQPLDKLGKQMTWVSQTPAALVRFIGIAEILGALGLILPAVTGIVPWLTIAAAIGLAIVMVLAAIVHIVRKEYSGTIPGIVLLILTLFVVYGRLVLVPFH
jgi:putative oxidoreductase